MSDLHPTNFVELVKYIENTLGWAWSWDDTRPPWKIRAEQAGRIKKAVAKKRVTVADLAVTVDYMRDRRISVESPIAVTYYVDKALQDARDAGVDSAVMVSRDEALAEVRASGEDQEVQDHWVRRVSRAGASALPEVVGEWRSRDS